MKRKVYPSAAPKRHAQYRPALRRSNGSPDSVFSKWGGAVITSAGVVGAALVIAFAISSVGSADRVVSQRASADLAAAIERIDAPGPAGPSAGVTIDTEAAQLLRSAVAAAERTAEALSNAPQPTEAAVAAREAAESAALAAERLGEAPAPIVNVRSGLSRPLYIFAAALLLFGILLLLGQSSSPALSPAIQSIKDEKEKVKLIGRVETANTIIKLITGVGAVFAMFYGVFEFIRADRQDLAPSPSLVFVDSAAPQFLPPPPTRLAIDGPVGEPTPRGAYSVYFDNGSAELPDGAAEQLLVLRQSLERCGAADAPARIVIHGYSSSADFDADNNLQNLSLANSRARAVFAAMFDGGAYSDEGLEDLDVEAISTPDSVDAYVYAWKQFEIMQAARPIIDLPTAGPRSAEIEALNRAAFVHILDLSQCEARRIGFRDMYYPAPPAAEPSAPVIGVD